jgi:RNA polymerase sigma-70 factor (ECF subfamily)
MSPGEGSGGIIGVMERDSGDVGVQSDEETYRKHAEELIRFATFLVGPSDAADVLAEAVSRAFYSSLWPHVANRRAYLYRSVLNQGRRFRRSEFRRRARESSVAPSEAIESITPMPEVVEAVAALSPRQRAVVYLTYWDDLGPPRIAELLEISEGSVRRHLARARATLRRRLHDQHFG